MCSVYVFTLFFSFLLLFLRHQGGWIFAVTAAKTYVTKRDFRWHSRVRQIGMEKVMALTARYGIRMILWGGVRLLIFVYSLLACDQTGHSVGTESVPVCSPRYGATLKATPSPPPPGLSQGDAHQRNRTGKREKKEQRRMRARGETGCSFSASCYSLWRPGLPPSLSFRPLLLGDLSLDVRKGSGEWHRACLRPVRVS